MSTHQPAPSNSSRTFVLHVLATFLPVALLTCGAAYYFYHSTQDRAAIHSRAREAVGIELGRGAISNVLQEIRRDLRLVSEHYALKNFLDQPVPGKLRDFEHDMLNLAAASRFYDQIRWLDETGMERVRVNFSHGNPVIVSAEALQNKHSRYYFPAISKLAHGEVYLSPLDLNIEHERIEIPYKPMLRIGTPVFDSHGDKRGIVLLNYLGDELLAHFDKATADIADHTMLLNQDGYWLKSPVPDEAWGFMFKRDDLTLARRHPTAWQRILAADSGQFEDAEGLWTFDTLYPQPPERTAFWKVVAHLPPHILYANPPLLKPLLAALAALLLLQFAASWRLVRIRHLRDEARDQVRYANRNLERLVAERTAQLQADIDLREQTEDRLRLKSAALETAANAIVITDTEGFIQWANPAYFHLTGYTMEELRGKRPRDLIKSGVQDQAFWAAFWQTIKSGQVWHGEVINKRKDGVLYTEEMTVTPVRDERGELTHFIAVKEDISTRKKLENALLESDQRLRQAAQAGNVGLWDWDLRTNQVFFSPEWKSQIGYQDHEVGNDFSEWENRVHPDDLQRMLQTVRTFIDQPHADYQAEFRFRHKNGTYRWILTHASLLFDEQGKPVRMLGSHIDITERKKKEFLLSESQRIAHVGSWQVDIPSWKVTWSDEGYRIYGFSPEIGGLDWESFNALLHPDDQPAMQEWARACLAKERPGELIFRAVLPDGRVRALSGYGDLQCDAAGNPVCMIGTVQDITEHKQAADALRESEARFRNLFEQASDGIFLISAENRYLEANTYGQEMVGYTREELLRMSVADVLVPHEQSRVDVESALMMAGQLHLAEWECRRKDGSTFSAEVSARRLNECSYLAIVRDLTERKKIEEELRQVSEQIQSVFAASTEISIIATTLDGIITIFNSGAERMLGYTAEEMIGRQTPEIIHLASEIEAHGVELSLEHERPIQGFDVFVEEARHGRHESREWTYIRKDGTHLSVNLVVTAVRGEGGAMNGFLGIANDITERKQAELHILNLNRVYTVLSNINQAIVRLRDIDMLFREACRIAVEDGGFRMAWIGLPDSDGRELQPAAHFGLTQDYLDNIHISLGNGARGRGPTGTAFHEGHYVCCNDIEHDPRMGPWKQRALELGYRASIGIPIKAKGLVRGVFNLYTNHTDFFTDEEIKLLEELADDLGFAMEVAEAEAERRRTDERLRQAAAVFESTREGVMVTDTDLRIRLVNQAFSEITGYSEIEVLGEKPSVLHSGRHDHDFYAEQWVSINVTGHWQGEIWNRRKNGDLYPELLSISAVKDEIGQVSGYVGVFADISKIKSSEAKLDFLAHHDPLTRLPNRLLMLSRLEHGIELAQREHRQLALLMLDLDRFKDVNDSFGHLAGDELLQLVAARLIAHLRGVDTVCRLGGDEFTVLLEEIAQPEDAARVANEIIAALSEPWQLANGVEVRISASIGISLFPLHGNSAAELLQQVDAALYQAKADGRGRYAYFTENMTRASRERIELEARLRRAIAQNELRVFYQPQVDIISGRITGAEALVRWQDPLEGLIPPIRFIPVAEATGLINAVGEWVLKETCLQGQRWIEAGLPPLTLAVNVSPHQFLSSDLVAVVTNALAETGFSATRLELELTESALMERQQEAVNTLERLRALGVRLAIDDFGTGYSSLAYLKRFPLDVLKIDKSFVDDIPHNQDDREIATAIVAMGHTLRFKVLAEGVETVEQLAFLQSQGCDSYQGYLKSPPLPPDAFAKLLLESRFE